MHFVVLGSPASWYLRDLARAADGRHRITQATFRQLTACVGPAGVRCSSGAVDMSGVDAVLVRTMPPGSLEQVVFRMDALARLEAAGVVVINPARAVEAAVDKYLATAKLQSAGLRVPRTAVCQTADDALRCFAELGGDVVLKPLFGSEGRGITRLTDEALAQRAFKMLEELGAVLYLQEFIAHEGCDLRLLLIGETVLAMRRRNPLDWRTNVSRGATAEAFSPDAKLVELARRAAASVGAPVAGVDILPGRDNHLYVIEVNAVPGWRALAAVTRQDVARLVLDYVASAVQAPRSS
ncbi:MAG: RimK family alpha-L-glutamate ligase [Planctomycetia bacterium]|nr:RimK family alpha-L-glutamate ligase [Planctomycetia bacterium]